MEEKLKVKLEELKQRKQKAIEQVNNWTAQVAACNGAIETVESLLKEESKIEEKKE